MAAIQETLEIPRLSPGQTYTFRESPIGRDMPPQWHDDVERFHRLKEDPGFRASNANRFIAVRNTNTLSAVTYEDLTSGVNSRLRMETEPVFMTPVPVETYADRIRVRRHLP